MVAPKFYYSDAFKQWGRSPLWQVVTSSETARLGKTFSPHRTKRTTWTFLKMFWRKNWKVTSQTKNTVSCRIKQRTWSMQRSHSKSASLNVPPLIACARSCACAVVSAEATPASINSFEDPERQQIQRTRRGDDLRRDSIRRMRPAEGAT
jgi:hypothetical protein